MLNIIRLLLVILLSASASADISFESDVVPVFNKYCVGCHNDDDSEGGFSLESFSALRNGGEHGPAIMPGNASASLLFRMVNGAAETKMPPEDEPAPNAAEIAVLHQWIKEGANGPSGNALRIKKLVTPKVAPAESESPITALAVSPNGNMIAIARFRSITLRNCTADSLIGQLTGHAGKINSLAFAGNDRLIAASGVTGLRGEIVEWDTKTLEPFRRIEGHRDIVYSAIPSPDGALIASAGYDRSIIIWDRSTGESLRQLDGHNGAVFDLAFTPDGKILASASADATVKIWDVASGRRLDTLSQPLKEQYSVAISRDGKFVYACGEDNRIRKWRLVSLNEPKINPLLIARFGHEQSVERIRLSPDGRFAVTASTDRTIKVWDADTLTQRQSYGDQPDSVQAIAIHPTTDVGVDW